MHNWRIVLPLTAILFSGCSPVYVMKSAAGHASLLWHRRDMSAMIADPSVPEPIKEKLRLVLEIRAFAFNEMRLRRTRDYSTLSKIHGPYVTYLVSASEKTRFKAYEWWFPVVGKFPYKGYYNERDAARERQALQRKGYDTYVGGVSAYSTPLWFSDPLPSSDLAYPAGDLASLLIHELTHGTIFLKNEVSFDETLAMFVGDQGARDFLAKRFGPESQQAREFAAGLEAERAFDALISGLYDQLSKIYESAIPDARKLEEREKVLAWGKERLKELRGEREGEEVNNAMILAHRVYHEELGDFAAAYELSGKDWPKTMALFKSLDPKRPREDLRARISEWKARPALKN